MIVRELITLLGVKTDKSSFQQGEKAMGLLVSKVLKFASAGAVLAGAFLGIKKAINATAEYGDQIKDMSAQLGIAARDLQMLDHVAKISGANISDVATSFKFLQKNVIAADKAESEQAKTFKKLGVSVKDSLGNYRSSTDILVEMADGFKNLKSPAERTSAALALFGRSGTTMIPALQGGSAALREMMEEAVALGGVLGDDLIEASDAYKDNLSKMDVVVRGLQSRIAGPFMRSFNRMYDKFFQWWKLNRGWIELKLDGAFKTLAQAFEDISGTIGGIVEWFVKWNKEMSPAEKHFRNLCIIAIVLGLLLMSGPIGKLILLGVVLGIVIQDFERWRTTGGGAIGELTAKLNEMTGVDVDGWLRGIVNNSGRNIYEMGKGIQEFCIAVLETIIAWVGGLGMSTDQLDQVSAHIKDIWKDWYAQSELGQAFGDAGEMLSDSGGRPQGGGPPAYDLGKQYANRPLGANPFSVVYTPEQKKRMMAGQQDWAYPWYDPASRSKYKTPGSSPFAQRGRGFHIGPERAMRAPAGAPAAPVVVNQQNDINIDTSIPNWIDPKRLAEEQKKMLADATAEANRQAAAIFSRKSVVP
ncbi:MAG: phage tail tape measure protein [Methylococcaceae bacterium]|nr:phage tail tape measure protein [Methylococcaceae bacterium]